MAHSRGAIYSLCIARHQQHKNMSSTSPHLDCGKLNCPQCLYIVLEEVSDEEMEANSKASSSSNGLEDILSSEDEEVEGRAEVKTEMPDQKQQWGHSCTDCADSPHSAPPSP